MKQIEIYQTADGKTELNIALEKDTVWVSQAQMCELFDKNKRTISEHIRNIFKEGELVENQVVRKFRTTADDGKQYQVGHYNLDVMISVGYRVKSQQGVRFRQWATTRLKEYLIQGYTIDQQRFDKNAQELEQALALINKTLRSPDVDHLSGKGLVMKKFTKNSWKLNLMNSHLANLRRQKKRVVGETQVLQDSQIHHRYRTEVQSTKKRIVRHAMVQAWWQVGRLIVEQE